MNKLNSNTLAHTGAYVAGTLGGSMLSRVLAEKIPLQNTKIKKGVLMAVGILGSAMIDNKNTTGKLLQGASIGMAVTQANSLIKEFIEPQGIFKTALGSPSTEYVFVENSTPYYDEYQEVSSTEPQFLSGVETQEDFAIV